MYIVVIEIKCKLFRFMWKFSSVIIVIFNVFWFWRFWLLIMIDVFIRRKIVVCFSFIFEVFCWICVIWFVYNIEGWRSDSFIVVFL